ncbi:MAG TPA: hypothetical protein VNO52_17645 [Methylomirabilota bacterium]|nr:hypothetical protein [Methylomirabilota bacterium]
MRHKCHQIWGRLLLVAFCAPSAVGAAGPPLLLSGNEGKIDLTPGVATFVPHAPPDSLSILDFSTFPPSVRHLVDVPNSVLGPPSNIAIAPNGRLALIANAVKPEPRNQTNWLPENFVHLLDLAARPPGVVGRVVTGLQPSGISIRADGRLALVANRAEGTISVLALDGLSATATHTVKVCAPADSVSDVAISPDGRLALASVQKGGYLALLELRADTVSATGRRISVYGQPYRCIITPDGELGLTAGQGYGNGLDHDALTVIDLKAAPIRAVDYVPLGAVPESIEISPDGRLLAAVVMNGSNLATTDPNHQPYGELVLLRREGRTFRLRERHRVGRIPEGVAFTSDGRYLVVQCHPDRELRVFAVKGGHLRDTGHRIPVPGRPSSLRASP